MKMILLLVISGLALSFCGLAHAGKNERGALIVHTDDTMFWRYPHLQCDYWDDWNLSLCEEANTQTDRSLDPSLIWFISAFPLDSDPSVTACCFGVDHNLPVDYIYWHNWQPCGPAGTYETAEYEWPYDPETASNCVMFGSPVSGNLFFPLYYFIVWGLEDTYFGSSINLDYGAAFFVDDSNPPVEDEITKFGQVRWFEPGYNECPDQPVASTETTWGKIRSRYR